MNAHLHVKVCLQDEDGLVINVLMAVILQFLNLVQALRLIDELCTEVVFVSAALHVLCSGEPYSTR
jgi:hypothetical protein